MEIEIIYKIFAFTIIALWVVLYITTLYQCNKKLLTKRGYTEEFISYLCKTNIKRNLGIAIVVPISGLAAGILVTSFIGNLEEVKNIIYVYLLWILFIIPFPILEMRKAPKELKEMIKKTNTDVIIDFRYKILHLVFNPTIEIIFSVVYVLYFMIFIELFHVAFIHIMILWLLYGAARYGKNLTRPGIREMYLLNFVFMMINHFLLIFHILREVMKRYSCFSCLSEAAFIIGLFLGIALICKAIFYLYKLPEYNLKLKL